MGLLEREIGELRQMSKDLAAEKIQPGEVTSQISIYKQVEKRCSLILKAYALAAIHGDHSLLRETKLI